MAIQFRCILTKMDRGAEPAAPLFQCFSDLPAGTPTESARDIRLYKLGNSASWSDAVNARQALALGEGQTANEEEKGASTQDAVAVSRSMEPKRIVSLDALWQEVARMQQRAPFQAPYYAQGAKESVREGLPCGNHNRES